jgi:hypothetical protein
MGDEVHQSLPYVVLQLGWKLIVQIKNEVIGINDLLARP